MKQNTKARFEVSTEGMRELQSGREPWQLAKELVSNSWDESTALCHVTLISTAPRRAKLTVYDDGGGFTDIKDAWTLMGHTPKRSDPMVRGRFNIGEKEILSVAIQATVKTAGKVIRFPKSGGRIIRNQNGDGTPGTEVECVLPWGPRQVEATAAKLKELLPPQNMTYTVNGDEVPHRTPTMVIDATLDTVLQDGPGEPMRNTRRKTQLELYPTDRGTLYEMGIPVQPIECPYLVNVMQKVPMPPNRDVVRDSYLQDIYTAILNATAESIDEPSATWVRMAVEDKDVESGAVRSIMTKRYGDKVALWSTNPRANEKAIHHGYEVVHGRTLSPTERGAMEGVGLQHTSDIFPTRFGDAEQVPSDQWTLGMIKVEHYACRLHKALFDKPLYVEIYRMPTGEAAAEYGHGRLAFNLSRLGRNWFDSIRPDTTALLLHEFAHSEGRWHDLEYYRNLQKLAGRAVHLALEKPDIFEGVQR